jgi:hypothetical protein
MRNEIKILPYFLRHYESFADRIFVWEDQSDDGTREMLDAHPLVTVLDPKFHGADDVYYVKTLWPQYKTISRGKADWVICVDADEFVYHWNMKKRLATLQAQGVKKIRLPGITAYHPTFPTTTGQIYSEVKVGWPDKWSTKTVLFSPAINMSWTPGRHQCITSRNIVTTRDTGIILLHFRYLGPEFFLEKNKRNYASMNIPYNPAKHQNLPDGSRGVPADWYESNKGKVRRFMK